MTSEDRTKNANEETSCCRTNQEQEIKNLYRNRWTEYQSDITYHDQCMENLCRSDLPKEPQLDKMVNSPTSRMQIQNQNNSWFTS